MTPSVVHELIERFARNREAYRSPSYNETQLRREFLDPFFKALGWDIDNEQGLAEAYKDVVHEDAIKVSGATKAPDYCFRVGGTRKFFVEAKKPAVNIREDASPAFQLRRYAWSAKLPLSILTDFEELAVYECRMRPDKNDKASSGRVKIYSFTDYADRWEDIAGLFSRDAILKGFFDKFAATSRRKKGTEEVDATFLNEIESWRELLATNIALRNKSLAQRELNFAVQRTIDRIIFLRVSEDRGIEEYGQLQALANGTGVFARLFNLFQRADDRYNSGLFHFHKEQDRLEPPDELSATLTIDDKALKEIIKGLYYPDSPYEFSVLPADILGQVYEQFLGKVIRLTKGHQAKIEDKPEVKKAGGVYYTPTYIVDYIVKHTVGKLLEGKTPKEVSKLRVLDPACGSGSFLIGAYQFLLDWHRDYYIEQSSVGADRRVRPSAKVPLYQAAGGEWRLTLEERRRILLNNIYGVDIDAQAVEVSKLSLLLKVLESERQLSIPHRALPDLGKNIQCGNSLIGPDFYEQQMLELDEEEKYRINVFDWQHGFPEIMKAGGFDAVIGNPPWGSLLTSAEKDYLLERYVSRAGEAESHLFFIERGVRLLDDNGLLGYITPNTWLAVRNSKEIRSFLLNEVCLTEISELTKYIFADAPDIVPVLFLAANSTRSANRCVVRRPSTDRIQASNFPDAFNTREIPQSVWQEDPSKAINLRSTTSVLQILRKCSESAKNLSEICNVLYGVKTGDNDVYLARKATSKHTVKALKTGELGRYSITWKEYFLWWGPHLAGFRASSVEVPKIIIQYIRKLSLQRRIVAAVDGSGEYYPLNNYSYATQKDTRYSLFYVLGVLNSSLLNFYFANSFIDYNIKPTYLQKLPIRTINFSDKHDKARHDKLVTLVERMLKLNKDLSTAKTPDEQTQLKRQSDATDRQIDVLVYELYGLTEEEIRIVEGE